MKPQFIAILSMPRNGTNYLCDLVGKFQEIDSLYEIYHNQAVYLNNGSLTNKILKHIERTYRLQFDSQKDPKFIDFVAKDPQKLIDALAVCSQKKYVSFKIFPNHLSQENLREIIIKNQQIKKVIVKRNLLDVYFSVQFARLIQRWDRKDTSDLKLEFNPSNFLDWFDVYRKYYDFIETELKNNNQEVNILEYERIHGLNDNQEKFIFLFNFLRATGLKLSQDNLFNNSPEELNKNIRNKQDKRKNKLEKVSNPKVLLNTLKRNQLESLLV